MSVKVEKKSVASELVDDYTITSIDGVRINFKVSTYAGKALVCPDDEELLQWYSDQETEKLISGLYANCLYFNAALNETAPDFEVLKQLGQRVRSILHLLYVRSCVDES